MWYYDFLSMNSNVLWFVILFVCAVAISHWGHDDIALPSLMAVVLLFSVVEIFSNYPMAWRDVYLQGSDVKTILTDGHLAFAWNTYSINYPGFFLMWSVTAAVTGLDLFSSNLLLMLPVTVILLGLLLVVFYNKLSIGMKGLPALLAFLLMNFNTNELTLTHFNTRLLSLIYSLLILVLFLHGWKERPIVIALVIVFFSLVTSHPLNSLLPLTFLASWWLLGTKEEGRGRSSLVLACMLIFGSWIAYAATQYLIAGANALTIENLMGSMQTASMWSPGTAKPEPFFGLVLRDYYKALLVILGIASLSALVMFRNERRVRILALLLLSTIVVFGISFLPLGQIAVDRGIMFASIPLSGLSLTLLSKLRKGRLNSLWRRVLVISIVILIIPNFVLVHETPIARYQTVPFVDTASTFISEHRNGQSLTSLADFNIYYSFYEPQYDNYRNLGFEGWRSLNVIADFLLASPSNSLKVIDHREAADWGLALYQATSYPQATQEWNQQVYSKLDAHYDRIYDSSVYTVYS
jgi:hypothetical protein